MEHQTIFSVKDLKRRIAVFLEETIKDKPAKIKTIQTWQENIYSGKILKQKEEELQSLFIHTFFGDILEYEYQNANNWNISIETRTDFDAKKSDGALGYFTIDNEQSIKSDIRVIIELKNARTPLDKPQNRKDFKGSPVEQAFMYANKAGEKCKWIIVSNFLEIRLYRSNDINKYESFDIQNLTIDQEFKRFYYLLAKNQLFLKNQNSVIDYALENRIEIEQKISKEFYSEYKVLRELFVRHIITYNKDKKHSPLQFLQFAQTIIDRVVFISVIKDYDLIAQNIVTQVINIAKSVFTDNGNELWEQLKNLFNAMDKGLPPRIHKFNGGLFKANTEIDALTIKNNFLRYLLRLSKYDFESDLNINILGHIFEQSITDIENLKTELLENNIENLPDDIEQIYKLKITVETNQRKIHGIFYTPEFITKYIINEAIGGWLHEQKEKIGLNKIQELTENTKNTNIQLKQWQDYQEKLQNVKILDPACGSGAFLTQAFDYLFREWQIVIDIIRKLKGILPQAKINGALNMETQVLPDNLQAWKIKKNIVSNNLYGVDLNNESVEITKLGLWLKTASKNDSLASLADNIKCGNSLIDAIDVVGDKAFVWERAFSNIYNPELYFKEKTKLLKEEQKEYIDTLEKTKNRNDDPKDYFPGKENIKLNLIRLYETLVIHTKHEINELNAWYKTNPQKQDGFDIIIGNPPYVRQENLEKEEKDFFVKRYPETGNQLADLYVYFYEKAIEILKPNGVLSFITPNKWFKTKYGKELRTYLKTFDIKKIVDFFENKIFEDVSTDTQIILLKNKKTTAKFDYYPIAKLEDFEELNIKPIIVNTADFNGSEWIFASPKHYQILKKMFKNSVSLEDYTNNGIEYGIKTGFNKAFIIDKETKEKIIKTDPNSIDLIKPYAVPVNIKDYYLKEPDEHSFINTGYDIEISENKYFGIYQHLKQYDKQLEKRQDKGKTHYNLRACSYYDKFETPKIIYIHTAVNHSFYYDTDGYYINNSCYIISNADKFLSVFLNSELFEFYKHLNFVAYGNPEKRGRCKLDYNKMVDVPIPIITEKERKEFELLHDKITEQYKQLYKAKTTFTDILKSQLKITKITKKLDNWHSLNWDSFNNELEKIKVKLSLKQSKEWNDFFSDEIDKVKPIIEEINEITMKLNNKIFEIYKISRNDITD